MDLMTRTHLDNIRSANKDAQNAAFSYLIGATDTPVGWAYEAWDELVESLTHRDNRVRAIASQVLCNLAKSDPEGRMLRDFAALLKVTKDERFVTARHCLQAIWKVGIAGKARQEMVLEGLAGRYRECVSEKNATLIRFDIIQGLRNLYDETRDEAIKARALALIDTEEDGKYRRKYAAVWRGA